MWANILRGGVCMESYINYIFRFLETISMVKLIFFGFIAGGLGALIYGITNDFMNYILYLFQ